MTARSNEKKWGEWDDDWGDDKVEAAGDTYSFSNGREKKGNTGGYARKRGKMPVGSEAKAKAAGKNTWRSIQASKRVSRTGGGMRNRRNKRLD